MTWHFFDHCTWDKQCLLPQKSMAILWRLQCQCFGASSVASRYQAKTSSAVRLATWYTRMNANKKVKSSSEDIAKSKIAIGLFCSPRGRFTMQPKLAQMWLVSATRTKQETEHHAMPKHSAFICKYLFTEISCWIYGGVLSKYLSQELVETKYRAKRFHASGVNKQLI